MANCPECGDGKADLGLIAVYCPNPECSHFDKKQLDVVVDDLQDDVDDRLDELSHGWVQFSFLDILDECYD